LAKKGNADSEGAQTNKTKKEPPKEPTKKEPTIQVEDAAAEPINKPNEGAASSAQPPQVGTGDDGERLAAETTPTAGDEIDRAIRELEDAVEETPPFKPPIITGPDGKWLSDIAIARHEILQWPEITGGPKVPLAIADGGRAGSYCKGSIMDAMSKNGSGDVTLLGVLDWLNVTCNLSGVSLNQGSVPEMVEEHFPKNDGSEPVPFPFTIAVLTADWNPEEHLGDFQLLSPIEELHACIRCMGSCKPSARNGWANQRRNLRHLFKGI